MRRISRMRCGVSTVIGMVLWPVTQVLAADQQEQPDIWVASIKTFGALFLILALIIAAAWAARRYLHFLPKSIGKGDHIQVLSVRALGPKRSLYLLEVEGQRLLVGATDGTINLLKEFPDTRANE